MNLDYPMPPTIKTEVYTPNLDEFSVKTKKDDASDGDDDVAGMVSGVKASFCATIDAMFVKICELEKKLDEAEQAQEKRKYNELTFDLAFTEGFGVEVFKPQRDLIKNRLGLCE